MSLELIFVCANPSAGKHAASRSRSDCRIAGLDVTDDMTCLKFVLFANSRVIGRAQMYVQRNVHFPLAQSFSQSDQRVQISVDHRPFQ